MEGMIQTLYVTVEREELKRLREDAAELALLKEAKVIMQHSGCGRGYQVDQLTVKLYPGDKVLMVRGEYGRAMLMLNDSQQPQDAAMQAAQGEINE